jgi:hypothetical protein
MSRGSSPPTLRCLVRAQRDAGTMFHHIPSPLPHQPHRLHTQRPFHPPRRHPPRLTPRQSHPRHRPTHLEHNATSHVAEHTKPSFPASTPCGITTSPHGHKSYAAPLAPPSSSNHASSYPRLKGPPTHSPSPSVSEEG